MGVATVADVAGYYNLSPSDAGEGLEAAAARPVRVEGWDLAGWTLPTACDTAPGMHDQVMHDEVLVGPFDNLLWDRRRVSRVFGFDYVFEAYKPQAKRRYGYYVLALLDHGWFTGRADVRRGSDGLTVLAAHPEPSVDAARFAASLGTARERLQAQLQR